MKNYKKISPGIYERSGKLYIEFRFNKVRFSELFRNSSPANIKAAIRLREAVLLEIDENRFDYRAYTLHFPQGNYGHVFGVTTSTKDTVGERLPVWLEGHKGFIEKATYKSYLSQIRVHLKPETDYIPIKAFTARHAKHLAVKLAEKGLSRKSISEAFIPLRQMFADCAANGEITSNPVQGFKIKNLKIDIAKSNKEEIDPFTEGEIFAILENLDGQMRNFYTLAFCSALRPSEIIELRWSDVDWLAWKIKVQRAKVLRQVKGTKTNITREIEILPLARIALKDQRQYTELRGHGYIFENPNTGKQFASDKSPREAFWTHALKRAKVRYRYPYQCKHSFVSHAILHGKPLTWIAKQAGHTTIQMIIRHYARFIDMPQTNAPAYWEMVEKKLKVFGDSSNDAA